MVSKWRRVLASCGSSTPHLDAVGLLDGEHFTVLLGSGDGHFQLRTHHWVLPELKFTARFAFS